MGRCQKERDPRERDEGERDRKEKGQRHGKVRRRWKDLSPGRKAAIAVTATAQLGLAGAAWCDLARRPADQVRGPKWRWALVIGVNWIGPIAYFVRGRRRP